MLEHNLDEVRKAAGQLTPEERFRLFEYLAGLPDSGIKAVPAAPLGKSLQVRKKGDDEEKLQKLNFQYNCQIQEDQVVYNLDGAEIFRVIFNAENCTNVFFDKLKSSDSFL